MCGICGFVAEDKFGADEGTVRQMCNMMLHRGPDDEGIHLSSSSGSVPILKVGLGHRRLSIIDLSPLARQPMHNEDETIWFVGNGEIYNFRELKEALIKKGHRFYSQSDMEVVGHAYEAYGEDFVRYLDGMFALAIWDGRKRKLILARDRLGKKPLLYTYFNGQFVFASEFKAILAYPGIDRKVNFKAIAYYLRLFYIPAPLTGFENIYKLPPAHLLVYQDQDIRMRKYWEPDFSTPLYISEDGACERIFEHLEKAVKMRLVSDVPLGAFLSGGIDSGVVVALMCRLTSKKVKTFSIGFSEHRYNELDYAREVARRYNTEHYELIVKPNALEVLPSLVEAYGEPFADSSAIPTYYVSKITRQYVKVALSGDGGDENFAGYERLFASRWANRYQAIPHWLRSFATNVFDRDTNRYTNTKDTLGRIARFLRAASLSGPERYEYWLSSIDKRLQSFLYSEAFAKKISGVNTTELFLKAFQGSKTEDIVNSALFVETQLTLANDYLVKVDIASMLNSLEVRCPFLDYKLMEFTSRLPSSLKLRLFSFKYILKKMITRYKLLPASILERKKMGFAIPISEWLRGELSGFVEDTLLSKTSLRRNYFNPERLRQILKLHMLRKQDLGPQIWTLLVLELWHKRFID